MDKERMLFEIIDRIGKTQDQMRDILIRMEADLKYHIKRTDLLEEEVDILREGLNKHVNAPFPWKKATLLVGFGSAIIGFLSKISGLL